MFNPTRKELALETRGRRQEERGCLSAAVPAMSSSAHRTRQLPGKQREPNIRQATTEGTGRDLRADFDQKGIHAHRLRVKYFTKFTTKLAALCLSNPTTPNSQRQSLSALSADSFLDISEISRGGDSLVFSIIYFLSNVVKKTVLFHIRLSQLPCSHLTTLPFLPPF